MGGALAAILVGPCAGVLCVAAVLLMQGIFFADGRRGLTTLGVIVTVTVTVMGVVTVLVAYGLFRLLTGALPSTRELADVLCSVIVPSSFRHRSVGVNRS